ncbi:MAG: MBL fold metallo-hydrolase [Myxococcaceae bacterium]
MRWTLHREVSLAVLARARTEADHHEDLGCSVLGPASRPVRRAQAELKSLMAKLGAEESAREGANLIKWLEQRPRYSALCTSRRRAGRRVLRPEFLFPDARETRPRFLHLRKGGQGLDIRVKRDEWPAFWDLFATLAAGASPAEFRGRTTQHFVSELKRARWLVPHQEPVRLPKTGALFVGHNTTLFCTPTAKILVDPYFRPASPFDLPGYQPMHPRDLQHVDAVLITHTHGDHFHLGSLLQLPRDVRIFVPAIGRESLFSTDCVLRLRQLGFTNVEALTWGKERTIGDATIRALPFYGEQPTDDVGVYGSLLNEGNTWLIRSPNFSAAFFADSGRDMRGDMAQVCREVRKSGHVDVLFTGIRGFRLKPLFFGFTTLDAFLVNVPLGDLTRPQQLMASPEEAMQYADILDARYVVPCADGGAPWYWREGMGPKYPGFPGELVVGASDLPENPDADPYPERLLDIPSPRAKPLLLRPGEAFAWRKDRARVLRYDGFKWPYVERARELFR